MGDTIRYSGIDIIGNVPWGTHCCQFYQTKEDLLSVLVPYFTAGLQNNEFCMWITAEPLNVDEAMIAMRASMPDFDAYLEKSQIEIIPYSEWYLAGGSFDSQRVLDGWINKHDDALNRGFAGLRLTGNTFWLEKSDWSAFVDYEEVINRVIGNYNMLAICTYSLEKCGAREILDVMNTHQFALIEKEGKWNVIQSTDRKRSESILHETVESLRDIELKYKSVFNNAVEGISHTTVDGQFIAVNSALAKMFGYDSPDEFLNNVSNIKDLLVDLSRREEFINEMRLKGRVIGFENILMRRDGEIIWVLVNSRSIANDNGNIMGYESFFNDITRIKKIEESLQKSEEIARQNAEELQQLMDVAPIALWVTRDPDCKTIIGNQVANQFLELGKGENASANQYLENIGTPIKYFQNGRELAPAELPMQISCDKGIIIRNVELEVHLPNGKKFSMLGNAVPLYNSEGKIRGGVSAFVDITERKIAESDLLAIKERLQLAQTNSNVGVWDWNTRTNELYFSPELENLYGLEPGSIKTYQDWRDRVHPDDITRVESTREEAINTGEPFDVVFRTQSTGDHVRWINAKGRAVYDDAGVVLRVTGINIDITERIQLEEELKNASFKAEQLVKERTSDLENANRALRDEIEERERSEKALRESQTMLAKAQAIAKIGNWTWDFETEKVSWSDEMYRIMGFERADFDGKLETIISRAVHPEDQERLREINEKARIANVYTPADFRIILPDGSERVAWAEGDILYNEAGDAIGAMGTVQDITEQKKNEARLRSTSLYARTLLEVNLDPLVTITLDGKINDANVAAEKVTGYTRNELIGSDFSDYFTEPEKARQGYLRAFNEGFVKDYPLAIRDKFGNITDVLYNATTFTNEAGEIQGVFADARDVTQQKKDEHRIRQQAELLDDAHDAITLRDLDNRLLYCNKGNERLYGWKSEEIVGKIAHEVFFKEASQQPLDALKAVKERGEWSGEMHHIDREGKEIIVDTRWTLMRDNDGNPESILVINTDITDKKKLEAQFLRTQRMESIGTLAGGIAHDLNNIFTPILLSVDLFKSKLSDDESLQLLDILDSNIKRGADLTRQILSFARGIDGERQPIQINRLISDIEKTMKEMFPKSIDVSTDVPEATWNVIGDQTQLHQVLMNLCLNARDAMPFGGSLRIEVESFIIDDNYARMNIEAKAGPYVVISVIDTGTGMAPAVMDHLFEPFFTTKKQGEGTGLGLPTSLGIVKSHGGFIHVYSEPGKGSTFKVYLPSTSMVEKHMADQEHVEDLQGHGELILIVDDEEMIRAIEATTLNKNGYITLIASDGAEAVAIYAQRKEEIAAILLDTMMPIMDGNAGIRALRKINPVVKIIGISGLGMNEKHHDLLSKANGFLTKPFTAEKLLHLLHEVLWS
jgi:PAS domain S-box-containing protein